MQDHELSLTGGSEKSLIMRLRVFRSDGDRCSPFLIIRVSRPRFNARIKWKELAYFRQNIGYSHIKNQGLGNTNGEYGGPLSSAINLDPLTPLIITDPPY